MRASAWAARPWPSPSPTRASPRRSARAATTAASGGGFHNGIDFEGKTGEPIYAAADGVINHQGWYFNYGRTVKISHADNFETLYAHMSRFDDSVGPGSHVRKGDLIGYVGSTGRSTGPHLHFSTIVNGVFVDPAPYISEGSMNSVLNAGALVAFRQWQQEVRDAAQGNKGARRRPRSLPQRAGRRAAGAKPVRLPARIASRPPLHRRRGAGPALRRAV